MYVTLDPRYELQVSIVNWNGNISVIAGLFVVYGLIRATMITRARLDRLNQFEDGMVDRN